MKLHLVPIVTELQFNFVADRRDVNSRKAVCRIRINGEVCWVDHLQGKGFFEYLKHNTTKFTKTLNEYGIKYIEASVSNAVLKRLRRYFGTQAILTDDRVWSDNLHHIRILI